MKTPDSPVTDIAAGSQQIKPAWAKTALPFPVSLLRSWESCSRGALEVIVPRSHTPCNPPSADLLPHHPLSLSLSLSLSLCLVSLSLDQGVMTPAPDCGRLKSFVVVCGCHLLVRSLCWWGGVGRKKGDRGGVAGACGGGWGWGVKGDTSITLSSDLNESITSCQTPNAHTGTNIHLPHPSTSNSYTHTHTHQNHPSCHWYHQQKVSEEKRRCVY